MLHVGLTHSLNMASDVEPIRFEEFVVGIKTLPSLFVASHALLFYLIWYLRILEIIRW